jgi:hypothetical protein
MNILYLAADCVVLFAAAWWLYRKQSSRLRPLYWPALVFKLLAGVGVGVTYFYHYGTGDTIVFWMDSVLLSQNLSKDPAATLHFLWADSAREGARIPGLAFNSDRSFFFVKILGILAFACANNYWMMSVLISFVAFTAAWYLFSTVSEFFPGAKNAAAVAFLFFPPAVFWSSGLIKESVGLASLYFIAATSIILIHHRRLMLTQYVILFIAVWAGWNLKYYWMGIFLPVALSVVVVSLAASRFPSLASFRLTYWFILTALLLVLGTSLHPNFYPERFFEVIWENNRAFMKLSHEQNTVVYDGLSPDFVSMLANSPKALIAGLWRPLPWEAYNALSFVAGLANLFILGAIIFSIPSLKKIRGSPNNVLVVATISYVVIMAILLALATPNFGTLDRYKVGFSPFLLLIALSQNTLMDKIFSTKHESPVH